MAKGKLQEYVALITLEGSYTEDQEQRALLVLETHSSNLLREVPIKVRRPQMKKEDWDVAQYMLFLKRLE